MFNCVIFGATGAIGREFTELLYKSKNWGQIYIITRRMIPKFEKVLEDERFNFLIQENILDLTELEKKLESSKTKINGVYNFLGTRTKTGKENFIKIDKTYVLKSFKFSQLVKANHFLHITSKGSNSNSCFLYMKTKGEVENELKKMDLDNITILKPGALLCRDNDARFGEKILSWIPFIPKIECKKVAEFAFKLTEMTLLENLKFGYRAYEHNEILKEKFK